jgi:hypothetical protein
LQLTLLKTAWAKQQCLLLLILEVFQGGQWCAKVAVLISLILVDVITQRVSAPQEM